MANKTGIFALCIFASAIATIALQDILAVIQKISTSTCVIQFLNPPNNNFEDSIAMIASYEASRSFRFTAPFLDSCSCSIGHYKNRSKDEKDCKKLPLSLQYPHFDENYTLILETSYMNFFENPTNFVDSEFVNLTCYSNDSRIFDIVALPVSWDHGLTYLGKEDEMIEYYDRVFLSRPRQKFPSKFPDVMK